MKQISEKSLEYFNFPTGVLITYRFVNYTHTEFIRDVNYDKEKDCFIELENKRESSLIETINYVKEKTQEIYEPKKKNPVRELLTIANEVADEYVKLNEVADEYVKLLEHEESRQKNEIGELNTLWSMIKKLSEIDPKSESETDEQTKI